MRYCGYCHNNPAPEPVEGTLAGRDSPCDDCRGVLDEMPKATAALAVLTTCNIQATITFLRGVATARRLFSRPPMVPTILVAGRNWRFDSWEVGQEEGPKLACYVGIRLTEADAQCYALFETALVAQRIDVGPLFPYPASMVTRDPDDVQTEDLQEWQDWAVAVLGALETTPKIAGFETCPACENHYYPTLGCESCGRAAATETA